MKTEFFKIGELSKFFHVSVDSIRYYEKVGILNPIRNEENNYRFYTIEDFRRIALIRELLGLGFSTDQIKQLVTDRNVDKTKTMLATELKTIDERIETLNFVRQNLKNRLTTINHMLEQYENEQIRELTIAERGCVMIRKKNLPDNMVDYYLINYMNEHKRYVGTIGLCDCYTLDLVGSNPESDFYRTKNVFFYSDTFTADECNYHLPQGTYLSLLYRGPLTKTKKLLPSLFDYANKKGYSPIGDPIEFCYIDEYETSNPDEYLIELQLLVNK